MREDRPHVRGALLALHAQTALHPGAGTALGTVDLPVQRERHTHWPTIAGSALKGILRDAVRERVKEQYQDEFGEEKGVKQVKRTRRQAANEDNEDVLALFGPGKLDDSTAFAGALAVTDARLLAFPVRSLKGVFAWVSCPAVLDRLLRDADLAKVPLPPKVEPIPADRVLLPTRDCPCLVGENNVVLEEFEFKPTETPQHKLADWIADHLLPNPPPYAATRERFKTHFLVLSDDDFTHFVRHATEVAARVGLDYETKTVRKGALFYQEFLPAETLFYSVVLSNPSRARDGKGKDADSLLKTLADWLPLVLQVGGDETTGKGICATRLDLETNS